MNNKSNRQIAFANNARRVAEIKSDIRRMIDERRKTIEEAERDLQTLLQTDAILFEYGSCLNVEANR